MNAIIFLDKDIHYTNTICELLTQTLDKASLFSFNSQNELNEYEKYKNSSFNILFFNSEEFNVHNFSGIKIKLQSFKSESIDSIYKFSPLSEFIRVITENINNYKNTSSVDREAEKICCVIGDCSINYRNKVICDIVLQKLKEGFIPVIAQICPNYQGYTNEKAVDSERNLSDLMMRIISGNTIDLAPGLYLDPMSDASMRFRPFQHSDDVYDCSADNIREFIQIMFEWINKKADPMYLIVILWSVPFSFIYSACMQSDKIVILNNSEKDFNSKQFDAEISSLLSNLRSTVKINGFYEFSKGVEYVLS